MRARLSLRRRAQGKIPRWALVSATERPSSTEGPRLALGVGRESVQRAVPCRPWVGPTRRLVGRPEGSACPFSAGRRAISADSSARVDTNLVLGHVLSATWARPTLWSSPGDGPAVWALVPGACGGDSRRRTCVAQGAQVRNESAASRGDTRVGPPAACVSRGGSVFARIISSYIPNTNLIHANACWYVLACIPIHI